MANSKGVKHDQDKLRTDLLPVEWIIGLAKVSTMGAKKYGDDNWRNGMEWSRTYGAVLRHLLDFWMGENKDKESGLCHLLHAAWGCLALFWYWLHNKGVDNRWKNSKEDSNE